MVNVGSTHRYGGLPVLCLVGAGVNSILTTKRLTDELLSWQGVLDPTGQMPIFGWHGAISQSSRAPFYTWLLSKLEKASKYRPSWNFEDLIHVVELVDSIVGLQAKIVPEQPDPELRSYSADLLAPTELGSILAQQSTERIAELSRAFILKKALELSTQQPLSNAGRLLAMLKSDGKRIVRVFSLNYDTSVTNPVETDWWTSYSEAGDDPAVFLPHGTIPDRRDLNIQMHGSVHFGRFGIDFSKVTRFRRYQDIAQAEKSWSEGYTGPDVSSDGYRIPAVPMITGRRKADQMLVEPFASYLHYFRQAAFTTPDWLLLGYGGSDDHINFVLQSAAEKWGPDLRVVICNRLPTEEYNSAGVLVAQPGDDIGNLSMFRVVRNPFLQEYYDCFFAGGSQRPIFRSRGNIIGRLMVTLDGEFVPHYRMIQYWFSRHKS